MKIPESVRIAGVDYKIKYVENLNDGGIMLSGQIDYSQSEIRLLPNVIAHQTMCEVLLHEVLHGICFDRDLKLRTDEKTIDALAKGLYQVLQDNVRNLFDIKD